MSLRLPVALALILAAALPGAASASVAGHDQGEGDLIIYAAAPGEANRVTVSVEGSAVTFQDPAATIEAAEGCTSTGPHRVTCEGLSFGISVALEDGDDEVSTSGAPPPGRYIAFEGASGADTLQAGSWPASLDGGVGTDVLEGGPGSPALDGTDVYAYSTFDRLPSRAPEQDRITCMAPPEGIDGTTASIDSLDQVSGPCGSTALYTAGYVLVQGTASPDNLDGGRGPSRIYGLDGNDSIFSNGRDRAYGGPGDDRLSGAGLMLGGKGNDRITMNSTSTERASIGGEEGDDFITGSNGRNKIDGGPGVDRISARGGADTIKVRDGERDVVRCGDGRDVVSADKRDSVARDCERVTRGSVAAAASHATATAAATRCAQSRAKGSKIRRKTSKAVVYERGGFRTYACLYSQNKPRLLPDEGGGEHSITLADRYVAYASFGSGIGDEFDRLYVYDIRAGRTAVFESSNSIAAIALKTNGSVAWTQRSIVASRGDAPTAYEVRKVSLAERQGNVLLDRGAGVAPKSLKLGGDGVTWTRDGAVQTAALG